MLINSGSVVRKVVSREEKMLSSETDPESYITEYTGVYQEKNEKIGRRQTACPRSGLAQFRQFCLGFVLAVTSPWLQISVLKP